MEKNLGTISSFMSNNYLHFNSAALVDAATSYKEFVANNGKVLITLAGAMSTAELGISLSEMIRNDKVHAISCTGANLEEDIFNLVAHEEYKRIPNYRDLTPKEEVQLRDMGLNRVTGTCIPEDSAIRVIEKFILPEWLKAQSEKKTLSPHQYFWNLLKNSEFKKFFQIDPKNSWMIAAMEKNIPIFTPGWEDSTLGNIFAAHMIDKKLSSSHIVESGLSMMVRLASWYKETSKNSKIGFFQIGGGIAGDFPICVVPMLEQDLGEKIDFWGYFCQISDSTTSYGSYSGAVPNEKISWGKLAEDTPRFVIESDATIVAPLMFAYILNW